MTNPLALMGALALAALAWSQDDKQAARLRELVKQLGAEDYEAREKATEELRKVGAPATDALREAARSGDPEVRTRAKDLLAELEKKPAAPRAPALGGSLSVTSVNGDTTYTLTPADGSPGIVFRRSAGGAVKLEYADEGGASRTAEAESLPAFLKSHAELAARYGITEEGVEYGGVRATFKAGGPPETPFRRPFRFRGIPTDEELEELFGPLLDESWEAPPRARPAAGATLEPAGETLRAHLDIPAGEGLVVLGVAAGTAADAAGLREHDVLLEIDGDVVRSADDVRRLLTTSSAVTVLRRGKREALRPAKSREEY